MKHIISFLVQGATLAALTASPLLATESRAPERYCNPLQIVTFPWGN